MEDWIWVGVLEMLGYFFYIEYLRMLICVIIFFFILSYDEEMLI